MLPLLLAGPILRRVDANQVCIWLACARPVLVRAEIFLASDPLKNRLNDFNDQRNAIGVGEVRSLMLGDHLHIALVVARPVPTQLNLHDQMTTFPYKTLLSYDLIIKDVVTGGSKRIADLGLTTGVNSIVYGGSQEDKSGSDNLLPTFFLADASMPLTVIHGSCRKLHGKGADCLVIADELIASSANDISKRPSALFLTGDQIYADDVADAISRYLTELGIWILGWDEQLHGLNKKLSEIGPGKRQRVIKEFANFTAGNAGNHLLGFGEFAAMYLLAWNPECWPENLSPSELDGNGAYKKQLKQLEETHRDLPSVRRVLANTPTYMIFDDHEITDDWNITREWHDNVEGNDCGKQVVVNGLVAYWAFQGWGNDPSLFDEEFQGKIVRYLGKPDTITEIDRTKVEDFFLSFHGWNFYAPTAPLAIFADTRTLREYDTFRGPPCLIGDRGLQEISRLADNAGLKKGDPVILVVPNPVLGFHLVELLQKAFARLFGVYTLDLESWYANNAGRVKFLTFILKTFAPRHCIFFSGDVHFGFTVTGAFAPIQERNSYSDILSITQLNSSAIKTTSLVKIAFVSEILGRIRQLFPLKRICREGKINRISGTEDRKKPDWIEVREIVHEAGSTLGPLVISDNNIGIVRIATDLSEISHRLTVRKTDLSVHVHQALVTTSDGKSPLAETIGSRISKIVS